MPASTDPLDPTALRRLAHKTVARNYAGIVTAEDVHDVATALLAVLDRAQQIREEEQEWERKRCAYELCSFCRDFGMPARITVLYWAHRAPHIDTLVPCPFSPNWERAYQEAQKGATT